MDDHQITELLENLEAWGEEFRTNQHGATLTILRARKTITEQAAMIKNMAEILTGRCKHDAGHDLNGVGMWLCNTCRADITPESLEEDADWGHPLAPGYYLKENSVISQPTGVDNQAEK